jgi:phasin family protein
MSDALITTNVDDGIATLTLNRPDTRNAMTAEMGRCVEAAVDAHADLDATRKAIAATTDPARVLELQAQWARANAEKCAAYWRRFYEVGVQMQASLAQCMVPAPAAVDESNRAMLTLVDQAYKQWLDTAQQFYKLPAIPAQSKPS